MNPKELIKSALTTMRMNKRRTLLTMFGIIIGIASVIAILNLGNGFQKETLSSLADDLEGRRSQDFYFGSDRYDINYESLEPFSRKNMNDIKEMEGVSDVKFAENNPDDSSTIYATVYMADQNEMYEGSSVESSDEEIIAGRNLTVTDHSGKHRNAVIGTSIVKNLFKGKSPEEVLHHSVQIEEKQYTIVGIYEATETDFETFSFDVLSSNPQFYVPKGTYELGQVETGTSMGITVYFEDDADMKKISKDISNYLAENGKEKNNGTYTYFDMSEMMDQIGAVLQNITYFITSIAGISLFIAGVGVMNMMYISVSERTKEIGIRRSLGATAQSIQWQFLLEGITISLFGGVVGYGLGTILSYLIASLLPFPAAPDVGSALFAVAVSTFIGIAFSVFPAKAAANKNVVEILR